MAELAARESAVCEVEAAYDRAWAQGDVVGLASCLAEDAVLVSPLGEVAAGRDDAERLLGEFLRGPAAGSTHSSEIVRISWVADDVAIVDGVATISDVDFEGSSTVRHRFTDVVVRRGGLWVIAHVRACGLEGD